MALYWPPAQNSWRRHCLKLECQACWHLLSSRYVYTSLYERLRTVHGIEISLVGFLIRLIDNSLNPYCNTGLKAEDKPTVPVFTPL